MTGGELQQFYEDLVRDLRAKGVICAITSGLACVHYGIAETTKDCDLLCHLAAFADFLATLEQTKVDGISCAYRGNISPPLDSRWHRGGWTSHFQWDLSQEPVLLDVFGSALRSSSPWQSDLTGLFAGPHVVAQMKRTQRDKDWPFITALGVRMLESDDERGWLHIFDGDLLAELMVERECPASVAAQRPALQFALHRDERTAGALNAERKLWEELDRKRAKLFERIMRPYVIEVRKWRGQREMSLREDHDRRVECATQHLPCEPLKDYGVSKFIDEARNRLVETAVIPEVALGWLPDVAKHFCEP